MNIRALVRNILRRINDKALPHPRTAKEYIEADIERLPLINDRSAINIDHCVRCIEKIPGILHPLEGFTLFLLSMSAPTDNMIVEVGSYLGRSAAYLALGSLISKKQGVCAVDMFPKASDWYLGEDGLYHIRGSDYYLEEHVYKERAAFFYGDHVYTSTLDIFKDIIRKVGLEAHIEPFKGNSRQCAQKLKAPLRMAFIDGDHTYDGVKKDILSLDHRIVENGYMCFHDYSVKFPGVVRAVNEYVVASENYGDIFQVRDLLVARKKSPAGEHAIPISQSRIV